MNARTFIDSNVFIYAAAEAAEEKGVAAAEWLRHLLRTDTGVSNLQVMNEVANVLIKRGSLGSEAVFSVVDDYAVFGMSAVGMETIAAARLLHLETRYSWWDCILLASAMELGCRYFLTEDLQHERRVRGLTILNPFRHSPTQLPVH